ncbi:MAG: two-component system sensor histidine kinase NtrB, partial [Opitutaceae bacterium]
LQLSGWLDSQASNLNTADEREALRRLKAGYDAYLRVAADAPGRPAARSGSADSLAVFTAIRTQSQHLFDLGQALAGAHYRSRNQLLAEAGQMVKGLRSSVLGLLALLFVFGIVLAAVAYRDLVAPLRVKLVQSQELAERREKLAALGMLAAGVAHEIRNPLTAIQAALFTQQKRFAPGSPEHGDSEVVQREISRLERIVGDFLRFARPSDPQLATIPIDRLFEDVRAILGPELAKAGIRLVVGGPAAWPVRVDPAQIKQVVINLVQNAADSIGRDGTITLGARRDRKWLYGAERDVVILEVADTGKGIPPEVGKRLFDPFFTTKDHGTGLGLSIAARIVEKHSGALQYQTRVHRGTTFGVVLPLAAA